MDTVIRNGMYKDALDLTAFANVLEKRHLQDFDVVNNSSDIGMKKSNIIIRGTVEEVRVASIGLRNHILILLEKDIQLPRCLQLVGYLKRLDNLMMKANVLSIDMQRTIDQFDLKQEFLDCRDKWFSKDIQLIFDQK